MDGNALPQWPKEVLNQLPPTQVPLLTWSVPAEAKSIEQWRYIARQLKQASSRTIMLRPIFPVQSPVAFRRAWRDMVKGFSAEQVYNVVWLWTPPRPEALSAYFPGAAYLDWMVADHPAEQANVSYAGIRHQAAQQFELHRKPVMLLATLPAGGTTAIALARRVASEYPEIRAVVYDNYVPARTASVPQTITPLRRTQKPTVTNAAVVREKLAVPTASKG
jgi:cellulose synthase (UDP-forming)